MALRCSDGLVGGIGDVVWAIVVSCVFLLPLAISLWALLDVARRPEWAWALAERNRVGWLAAILLGTFITPVGLAISLWYLLKVRPQIAAVEAGRFDG